jgi:hypothetical protein
VTAVKNEVYRRMQQRHHTRKAVEEYRMARIEEKRAQGKKKNTRSMNSGTSTSQKHK